MSRALRVAGVGGVLLAVAGTSAIAAGGSSAASAAAPSARDELHPTRPIDLGLGAFGLESLSDGRVRAAIAIPAARKHGLERAALTTFSVGHAPRRIRVIGSAIPRSSVVLDLSTASSGDGLLRAVRVREDGQVSIRADDGRHAPRISGTLAKPNDPEAFAGGGATGVLFTSRAPRGLPQAFVALRPPRRDAYRAPVAVDAPAAVGRMQYAFAFGPNGDGALVAQPRFADEPGTPARVRRIDRSGQLGPWIAVGDNVDNGTAQVAVASDGAIAVAMVESDGVDPASTTPPAAPDHLITAALLPGQETATPVQRWPVAGDAVDLLDGYDGLSLAFGSGDRLVVAEGSYTLNQVTVLQGLAGTLSLQGTLPTYEPKTTHVILTDTGEVVVVWTQETRDGVDNTILASTDAGASGAMSSPTAVVTTHLPHRGRSDSGDVTPQFLVPGFGGESLLVYADAGGRSDRVENELVRLRFR